jgi:hypothetical protein
MAVITILVATVLVLKVAALFPPLVVVARDQLLFLRLPSIEFTGLLVLLYRQDVGVPLPVLQSKRYKISPVLHKLRIVVTNQGVLVRCCDVKLASYAMSVKDYAHHLMHLRGTGVMASCSSCHSKSRSALLGGGSVMMPSLCVVV